MSISQIAEKFEMVGIQSKILSPWLVTLAVLTFVPILTVYGLIWQLGHYEDMLTAIKWGIGQTPKQY
jgi:hypothetical protein